MDPCLKETLLTKTVWVASMTGRGASGQATYGPPREIKAYVEPATEEVLEAHGLSTGAQGRSRETMYFVVVEDEVLDTDKMWLPWMNPASVGETDAQRVESVLFFYDPFDPEVVDHYEVIA